MDLKPKNKSWVGNIYHKFETVCQGVDDFVTKETVKYVESQVQNVGQSVKRFYSDVQHLLPSTLVKRDDEVVHQETDADSYTKSLIDVGEKHVDIDTSQTPVEHDPVDPLQNCYASPETVLNRVKPTMSMPTDVRCKQPDSVIHLRQDGDALVYPHKSDEGNNNSGVRTTKKEKTLFEGFTSSPEHKSETSLLDECTDDYHNNEILGEVSFANLLDGATISSSKERPKCDSSFGDRNSDNSSDLQSSEMAFSVVSFGNEVAGMKLFSSSSFLSTESYDLPEECSHTISEEIQGHSHESSQEKDNIYHNHADAVPWVSHTVPALSSSESCPDPVIENAADMQFALPNYGLLLEPTDVDSFILDNAISIDGSSANLYDLHCKCSLIHGRLPSLEIGYVDDSNIDIQDPSVEITDLSDKGKLDESCILVDSKMDNNKLLSAFSCRARRHRSYKKIIQDAFDSRKRLTKEYEQLAIIYGDIDMDPVQQPKQNASLSVTDMSLEGTKHLLPKGLCDSEWELL